jgi:hypothetical protein
LKDDQEIQTLQVAIVRWLAYVPRQRPLRMLVDLLFLLKSLGGTGGLRHARPEFVEEASTRVRDSWFVFLILRACITGVVLLIEDGLLCSHPA